MIDFLKQFKDPSSEYYPAINWVWNSVITKEGIVRQVDEFKKAGFLAVLIMTEPKEFRPKSMATNLEPEYLSDEFFSLVRFAADEIKKRDMKIWLYDEGGWPSGSACTQVVKADNSLSEKRVTIVPRYFEAGKKYKPLVDKEGFVFLVAFAENMQRIKEGFFFYEHTVVYEYRMRDEIRWTNGYYHTDIADPKTAAKFIELTHEGYRKAISVSDNDEFDKNVVMIFDDEPSLPPDAWTEGLEVLFSNKYGYDLFDFMPFIFGKRSPETEEQIRAKIDYKLLLTEIIRDNYFLPIRDWCRAYGTAFGGHLDGEHDAYNFIHNMRYGNPMEILRSYDIPGVDVIWRQILPDDVLDEKKENICFFPRYASSAARQIGKDKAFSESFAVYGDGITFDEMRYIVASQSIRGINMFDFMLASYDKEKASALVERPAFAPEKPGFYNLKQINDYTARLNLLTTYFKPNTKTALYLPVRDILVGGEEGKNKARSYEILAEELERSLIDFDIIDDAAIITAELCDGELKIGDASYSCIYVPDNIEYMPEIVKTKIQRVIFKNAQPDFSSDCSFIRGRKLIDGKGNEIYIVFNQSNKPCTAMLDFADGRPAYQFKVETGDIYNVSSNNGRMSLSLSGGGFSAILFTECEMSAQKEILPDNAMLIASIENFRMKRLSEFVITRKGIEKKIYKSENFINTNLCGWESEYGKDFSGTVLYETEFTIDDICDSETLLLDLGRIDYSARVLINGEEVGICGMTPNYIKFSSKLLKRNNRLEIEVSNTAANRCVATDFSKFWAKKYVGPYDKVSRKFENDHLSGGLFGPVRIYKEMLI